MFIHSDFLYVWKSEILHVFIIRFMVEHFNSATCPCKINRCDRKLFIDSMNKRLQTSRGSILPVHWHYSIVRKKILYSIQPLCALLSPSISLPTLPNSQTS